MEIKQQPSRMHRLGVPERTTVVMIDPLSEIFKIDRNVFNSLSASRKQDRTCIADVLEAICMEHGATVERRDTDAVRGYGGRGIRLGIACRGVGADIGISDLHGGEWALISWFNATHPARNFTAQFQRVIASGGNGRPHHKATSHPRDWYSLAMMLDAGLSLAASGRVFDEPSAT